MNTMPNASAIPRDDAGKLALLQHLAANLHGYVELLEISPADLAQIKAGAAWFECVLKAQDAAQDYSSALFALKRVLRDGPRSASVAFPSPPLPPALPEAPPFADIFGFVGALITRIKKHRKYTEAIGQALRIIAAQSPGVDPATLQPVLSVDFQGGHPVIAWKGNGADALELEADHGDGVFRLMTIRSRSGYQDNTPLPAPGTAVVWRYRGIFIINDERVGHWSQVLEVGVKGG
jgi:hypothetical protein